MTNVCKNMIFTCALGARVIRIKSTKTEHKPIYFHSKPSTNMADNKAINAIKAHASCDHERALYTDKCTCPSCRRQLYALAGFLLSPLYGVGTLSLAACLYACPVINRQKACVCKVFWAQLYFKCQNDNQHCMRCSRRKKVHVHELVILKKEIIRCLQLVKRRRNVYG